MIFGPQGVWVEERYRGVFGVGPHALMLTNVPDGAQLETLTLRGSRAPIRLMAWHRAGTRDAGPPTPWTLQRDAVQWATPNAAERRKDGEVTLEIESPTLLGETDFSVFYRITGMTWRADYQIVFRSDPSQTDQPISLNIAGWYVVSNGAARTWHAEAARWMTAGAREPNRVIEDPGFLELAPDDRLADPWRDRAPDPQPVYTYALDRPLTLPAAAVTRRAFLQAERKPADWLYVLRPENQASGPGLDGPERPLRQTLRMINDVRHGLGTALPSGRVELFTTAGWPRPFGAATLSHAEVGGEVLVDVGESKDVTAIRRAFELPPAFGMQRLKCEILIENRSSREVRALIEETPPVNLGWHVVRATEAYREEVHGLSFRLVVPGASRRTIEYELAFRRPSL